MKVKNKLNKKLKSDRQRETETRRERHREKSQLALRKGPASRPAQSQRRRLGRFRLAPARERLAKIANLPGLLQRGPHGIPALPFSLLLLGLIYWTSHLPFAGKGRGRGGGGGGGCQQSLFCVYSKLVVHVPCLNAWSLPGVVLADLLVLAD